MPKSTLDVSALERLERAHRMTGDDIRKVAWAVDVVTADLEHTNPARYTYLQGILPGHLRRRIRAQKRRQKFARKNPTKSSTSMNDAKGRELYHKKRSRD